VKDDIQLATLNSIQILLFIEFMSNTDVIKKEITLFSYAFYLQFFKDEKLLLNHLDNQPILILYITFSHKISRLEFLIRKFL
jgi:hypothetical protein